MEYCVSGGIRRSVPCALTPDPEVKPWSQLAPEVRELLWTAGLVTVKHLEETSIRDLSRIVSERQARKVRRIVPRLAAPGEVVVCRPRGNLQTGNVISPGRMRLETREMCRAAFHGRLEKIEAIADGEPVIIAEVPLGEFLKHAECPECGEKLRLRKGQKKKVRLQAVTSASISDRLRALDTLGKYGLGTQSTETEGTVTDEDVEELVAGLALASEPFLREDDLKRFADAWMAVIRGKFPALRLG